MLGIKDGWRGVYVIGDGTAAIGLRDRFFDATYAASGYSDQAGSHFLIRTFI